MKSSLKFSTDHKDVIHDVSYDFYGKRIATCSSDQKIKIWDLNDKGEFVLTAEWKGHKGSIWRAEWCHPEYGQVVASCSYDRSVCIWEEGDDDGRGNRKWHKKIEIVDSKDSVCDTKFAPHHMGLKLATCSTDGFVRIYEALDIMNLNHWPLIAEFESHKTGSNCISWNPSPFDRPMIVVGSKDPDVKVWELDETGKWKVLYTLSGHAEEVHDVAWAPNLGRTYHLIASASKDKTVRIWRIPTTKLSGESGPQQVAVLDEHRDAVWRAEWNITGTILATSGDDGYVFLWKANFKNEWVRLGVINSDDEDGETFGKAL